jgi:DNA-directed RNA polymerase specialized sigma24 family protein
LFHEMSPADESSGRWKRLRRVAVKAARRSATPGSVEDAAHEALLNLLKAERKGEKVANSAAFVALQARFRSADEARTVERRKSREAEYARRSSTSSADGVATTQLAEFDLDLPADLAAIGRLLLLGHTRREIAKKTRMTLGTVHRRIERLRDYLADQLPSRRRRERGKESG